MTRKSAFLSITLTIILASCIPQTKLQTLTDLKKDLECIEYKDKFIWKEVAEVFGNPDIAPLPDSELSKNTRIYKDKIIIFYTETQEVQMGEKVRFQEVVTKVEVCKKK